MDAPSIFSSSLGSIIGSTIHLIILNQPQPSLSWDEEDFPGECERFKLHVQAYWDGPMYSDNATKKMGCFKLWIGDKGRKLFQDCFQGSVHNDPSVVLDTFERRLIHNYHRKDLVYSTGMSEQPDVSSPAFCDSGVSSSAPQSQGDGFCEYQSNEGVVFPVMAEGVDTPQHSTEYAYQDEEGSSSEDSMAVGSASTSRVVEGDADEIPSFNDDGAVEFHSIGTLAVEESTNTPADIPTPGSESSPSSQAEGGSVDPLIDPHYEDIALTGDNDETVAKTNIPYQADVRSLDRRGHGQGDGQNGPTGFSDNINAHGDRFGADGQSARPVRTPSRERPITRVDRILPGGRVHEVTARLFEDKAGESIKPTVAGQAETNNNDVPVEEEVVEEGAVGGEIAGTPAATPIPCNVIPDETPLWQVESSITDDKTVFECPLEVFKKLDEHFEGHLGVTIEDFMGKKRFRIFEIEKYKNKTMRELLIQHPEFKTYTLRQLKDDLSDLGLTVLVRDIERIMVRSNQL